ncbi:hypothetical protein FACS189423_06840 [Bacteroidia bacterium]|nr:hypothetical protein FACS189423_06840 [Bacteroidia bacterium]
MLGIFLLPIVGPCLYDKFDWNIGELYTFNLDPKDFYPIWITLFGAIGAGYEIWHALKQTRNNRFFNNFVKSVELLGSNNESARIGSIYGLYFLAKKYPEDYENNVFETLCGHVRSKTAEEKYRRTYTKKPSSDIRMLLNLLFREESELSKDKDFFKRFKNAYLDGCYLRQAYLSKASLQGAKFTEADLQRADFNGAKLEKAKFSGADLGGANFNGAKLKGADFKDAKLKGAKFEGADLEGAIYNDKTIFSKGFDPEERRMKKAK